MYYCGLESPSVGVYLSRKIMDYKATRLEKICANYLAYQYKRATLLSTVWHWVTMSRRNMSLI